jgi:catechol 2,3-dioxygenase-like lactoylglutathione lyase family enzyme
MATIESHAAPAFKEREAARAPLALTRGIHHLVFNTDDMKMTIDFYCDVLGMRLIHGFKTEPGVAAAAGKRGNPPFECIRHYFFDMGNDSVLAFFELPKNGPKADRNAVGGMQHASFFVEKEADYNELIRRLKACGVEIYGPIRMTSGPGFSFYFFDPNGIRLEASCIPEGAAPVGVIKNVTQTKRQMRAELATLHDDPVWLEKVMAGLPE